MFPFRRHIDFARNRNVSLKKTHRFRSSFGLVFYWREKTNEMETSRVHEYPMYEIIGSGHFAIVVQTKNNLVLKLTTDINEEKFYTHLEAHRVKYILRRVLTEIVSLDSLTIPESIANDRRWEQFIKNVMRTRKKQILVIVLERLTKTFKDISHPRKYKNELFNIIKDMYRIGVYPPKFHFRNIGLLDDQIKIFDFGHYQLGRPIKMCDACVRQKLPTFP